MSALCLRIGQGDMDGLFWSQSFGAFIFLTKNLFHRINKPRLTSCNSIYLTWGWRWRRRRAFASRRRRWWWGSPADNIQAHEYSALGAAQH